MSSSHISSIVSSVSIGISQAKLSQDPQVLKEAIRSFGKPEADSFSSSSVAKLKNIPTAAQGSISAPADFYKSLSPVASSIHSKDLETALRDPGLNVRQRIGDLIKKWEEKLNSVGDDAQLANVDMQNTLQKQQQTLQMLSNISKMLYDTVQGIIRKIGG